MLKFSEVPMSEYDKPQQPQPFVNKPINDSLSFLDNFTKEARDKNAKSEAEFINNYYNNKKGV